MESHPHPYAPKDLHLPGFIPISLSQLTIVGIYGVASFLVVSLVWLFSGLVGRIRKTDRLLMCWWAFTGLTHIILEGYFVFSPEFFKDKTGFYLAEIWKEYSKGDSRYAARDAGVVSVEAITAVLEGPACLLAVYAIGANKSFSHVLQLSISLGQLYGTAVYYLTSFLDGDHFAASPTYYKAYFIGANVSWVVIPTLIVIRSWKNICAAAAAATAAFNIQQQKKKTKAK